MIASLNRPGGNLTGITTLNAELLPKRVELLHQLVPAAASVALLVNRTGPNAETLSQDARAAARSLGFELQVLSASYEGDFEPAFTALTERRAGGLVISADHPSPAAARSSRRWHCISEYRPCSSSVSSSLPAG